MTLIAAWRCADAIVMHADSQETVGHYRRTVQKIRPQKLAGFEFSIGGSGHAELIESFLVLFERRLLAGKGSRIQDFVDVFEATLDHFYKTDFVTCPDPLDEKRIQLLAGVSCPQGGEFDLFVTENVRLRSVADFELIGWEEPVYGSFARRFHAKNLTRAQAILAGLYVFAVGEESSNYIRSPISVAVIDSSGIRMESDGYVKDLSRDLTEYDQRLNDLLLACADRTIPFQRLRTQFRLVTEWAVAIHRKHSDLVFHDVVPIAPGTTGTWTVADRDDLPPLVLTTNPSDKWRQFVFDHELKQWIEYDPSQKAKK